MKYAKRIGALICVIAVCFTLMAAPSAHATGLLGSRALGALTAAGLVSLGIVAQTGAMAIGNYFGWQAAPTPKTLLEYNFPVEYQLINDYMNASTIEVNKNVVTIDGVQYDEVFISPGTFSRGLKTNIFDFKSKWAILSGQAGTLAEGAGYVSGVPMYRTSSGLTSQTYTGNFGISNAGNFQLNPTKSASFTIANGSTRKSNWINLQDYNMPYYFNVYQDGGSISTKVVLSDVKASKPTWVATWSGLQFEEDSFEYTYTSGIVPAEESDIPENYGLSIQIPHDQLQTFYNTYPQYSLNNNIINIQEDEVDIDQLIEAIFDQITNMNQIKGEWREGDIPDPAEDILEGINTIIGKQDSQISQNQQDIAIQQQQLQQQQQQLQEQQQISQNTSSIKDAIDNVTQTPSSEDLPDFKFDLRELFPFCIPFDIYRLLSSFDAEPVAPHVQLPIVIDSINFRYNLDLDFSAWNPVAQAMRTAELIVYAIALAWATGKVIKW